MSYLLDTNVVIAVLKNRPEAVRARLRQARAADGALMVSAVVLYELWHGVARSADPIQNAHRVRAFLAGDIGVLAFDDDDAIAAGELRAELEAVGLPIGPYDLMIAAQARRRGLTLVTANVSEFSRVAGLAWEDWSR